MQNTKVRIPLNPSKVLALGFFAIIVTGGLLLKLPFAAEEGVRISLLQAMFTATSAVCVTGLTVVDTVNSYTLFGELVILCLIQLGGLGFMFFATSVLVLTGRRISLRNRMLLHETMSMPGLSGSVRMTMRFMLIVMAVELMGSIILSSQFVPLYGFWKGIYFGFFHAISAFCNAGFDLFGTAGSLRSFNQQPAVLLTVSGLIIVGGLGFTVLADLLDQRFRFKKLHLHSKIVLTVSCFLLVGGALIIALIEWDNPETLAHAGAGPFDKAMNAWFQSTTARTAGYYSFWQAKLHDSSKLVTIVLMFIGASPASTGGGIKTTTIFTLVMLARRM
jgi:trk system potassium uptake protein TrkH